MADHEEPYDAGCPCLTCSTYFAEMERAHYEQWLAEQGVKGNEV